MDKPHSCPSFSSGINEKAREVLFQSMREGVCFHKVIYDGNDRAIDYVITSVNSAYEAITGLSNQIVVGRKASEIYSTGEPPYLEIYAAVAKTGKATSFETYFAPMEKHFNISVFSPGAGEFVTIFTDITQQKKEQHELKEYRDRLESLVETRTYELLEANKRLSAEVISRKVAESDARAQRQLFIDVLDTLPCYLILLTPDYHVPFANKFFRERFGDSHGKRCFEYLFNRLTPCEVCDTFKVLQNMQPLRWEWTGPDGHIYDIYDFPFHDVDGATLIMEAGIDITEQRKTEAELKATHAELEKRVEERTTELNQKSTELERSNRDLETFAFAASHDLQEPLRMVTNFAQILVSDLLLFSRIQSRVAPFVNVDLTDVLKSALENLVMTITETKGIVTTDPLPTIYGDSTQILQLFQNLIGNALKYHKDATPPIIHIGVGQNTKREYINIYIKDNGIGIDPKHFDRIFLPFHRLHSWKKYPGTGMGLASCKKIIERHGGKIWVDSVPGEGTTFYFT